MERSWCVRVGQPGEPAVLIVTELEELLPAIAELVVEAGFTAFVALPSVSSDLQRCARFDLILAYGDLATPIVDGPPDQTRALRLIRERLTRLDERLRVEDECA